MYKMKKGYKLEKVNLISASGYVWRLTVSGNVGNLWNNLYQEL